MTADVWFFDVDKIDKALHKAAEKVMDVTPLVEKRLSTLVERIVEEIIAVSHKV